MAKGTSAGDMKKLDPEAKTSADEQQFQTGFQVNSKKNSGPQTYGNNNQVQIYKMCYYFIGDNNRYNILSELDTTSGEESYESDSGDSTSRSNSKNDTKKKQKNKISDDTVFDGEQLKVQREDIDTLQSESKLNFDKKVEKRCKSDDVTSSKKEIWVTATEISKKKIQISKKEHFKKMKVTKKPRKTTDHVDVFRQNPSTDSNLAQPVIHVTAENENKQRSGETDIEKNPNECDTNPVDIPFQLRRRSNRNADHPSTFDSKTEDENENRRESRDSNESTKRRKLFAPVQIAIVQMICYGLCILTGCLLDWPLWILPYLCYLIFAIINLLACISCVKLKFVKPIKDDIENNKGK